MQLPFNCRASRLLLLVPLDSDGLCRFAVFTAGIDTAAAASWKDANCPLATKCPPSTIDRPTDHLPLIPQSCNKSPAYAALMFQTLLATRQAGYFSPHNGSFLVPSARLLRLFLLDAQKQRDLAKETRMEMIASASAAFGNLLLTGQPAAEAWSNNGRFHPASHPQPICTLSEVRGNASRRETDHARKIASVLLLFLQPILSTIVLSEKDEEIVNWTVLPQFLVMTTVAWGIIRLLCWGRCHGYYASSSCRFLRRCMYTGYSGRDAYIW